VASPRDLLQRYGLKPKQSWGQNFLGDEEALARIAGVAGVGPGDVAVELGPGLGHLTAHLARTGARVVAVERDRDMVRVLEERRLPGVTVVAGNAAEVRFAEVAGAAQVVVVGNLPYHLSSPILFQVLDQRETVKRAVFTLQKEVVTRLTAPPGHREAGVLTALLGLYFDVGYQFTLPARLFHPPPKVDSAVVRLTRLERPRAEVTSDERYRRVVKAAFAQRRKTVANSMRSDPSLGGPEVIATALAAAGIDPGRRGETLTVEELAAVERALAVT
jgi:16S rRNA (adenine1518-N6/adenine1519-N6)-dimethyltransferase